MALPAELTKNVPTLEEFWALYTKTREEEAKRREEEAKRREEEAKRREEEAKRREEEAKRREEEAKRREEEAKRREEARAKYRAEWDRSIVELRELQEKTQRTVDRVGKQLGEVHHRFGELAEHLVAPGIAARLNELGYHFNDLIAENVKIQDDSGLNILTEIDLLLNNEDYSIAVEIKSRPAEKDIAHHVRRLELLREHMDKHNDRRKICGAIAGAVFPEEAKKAAMAEGLYVIEQSGDTMKMGTPKDFKPREW